jgi:hemerythrin-like metal-binding protein
MRYDRSMRVFKWNAGHAVYLPEIDAEHRAIFTTAGDLQKAVEGNAPVERILESLHSLLAASEDHFAHEERLMEETRYASLSWHAQQHEAARKRLKLFAERIGAGEEDAAALMLEFLSTWMRDHMAVADRMMGAYLRNYRRSHAA